MLECWRKCKRILANRILLFKTHYISRESQVPDNIKGFHLLFLCQINLLIAYLVGPWSNIIQLHGQLYPYFVDQKWHFSLFCETDWRNHRYMVVLGIIFADVCIYTQLKNDVLAFERGWTCGWFNFHQFLDALWSTWVGSTSISSNREGCKMR